MIRWSRNPRPVVGKLISQQSQISTSTPKLVFAKNVLNLVEVRSLRSTNFLLTLPSTLALYTCFVYLLLFILSICPNHLNIPFSILDTKSSFTP
ncbi:hypothetical protein ANTRET_LOCUS5444 [Anthophora retusa]